ncbi:hypothetical protein RH858_13805 [Halalkaliarchaeum sp. AArc-GB]|uniref:hypothetical protein n=1 Tax=Halalkaliarchaeum sp. AArc-GB TaxID=3074078 RepID=UPI002866920B|nr:hypothetical protein [Halalkaliarchaeum sp. AArc-GB]MDR5674205.1 hypothetical protein [Halalkaliarchaeum sp. AArc-GB]
MAGEAVDIDRDDPLSDDSRPNDSRPDDPMLVAYRHDAHKLTGHPHEAAPETHAGVPVNRTVPLGADGDAAALSRPGADPRQTVDNHATGYRLSVLTGETQFDLENASRATLASAIDDLLAIPDPETAHRTWLTSDVAALFNESSYYPYTSLKYHTLLVAALLDNYRAGHDFADLRLVVDPGDVIVPHRTVYVDRVDTVDEAAEIDDDTDTGDFALRITGDPTPDRPTTRLGTHPRRSWASTWSNLPAHPLETDRDRFDRVLDANLRRIRSWSTALQYLEDFGGWRPER